MNGSTSKSSNLQRKILSKKLTRTEVVLALVLTIAIACLLYQLITDEDGQQCTDVAYYKSLTEMQSLVDSSVNPCQDFHQFTCGHYIAYKEQASDFSNEEDELKKEFDAMIVDEILPGDSKPIKMQKMFYHSCINKEVNETVREGTILNLVRQIEGWPRYVNETWEDEEFDWSSIMVQCKRLGLPFQWFLDFGIHSDEINYLKISYPTKFQTDDSYNVSDLTNELLLATSLDDIQHATFNHNDILVLNNKLIELTHESQCELSLKTIKKLEDIHPEFDWLELIKTITDDGFVIKETVVASNVDKYLRKLFQFLSKISKRTQANYILWKIAHDLGPYMRITETHDQDRMEFCKTKTKENFRYLSEIEYIRRYSYPDVTNSAKELAQFIHQEFRNRVEGLTWWNATAAKIYLKEVDNIEIDVGLAFEEIFDDDFVDANYLHLGQCSLKLENINIIELVTEKTKCYYASLFGSIGKTGIDLEKKNLVLQASNFRFDESWKKMIVPPSRLHGVLYDHKRPHYLNFGSLGSILALEFVQKLQILIEQDIGKNVTNMAFEASNKCLEEDYERMRTEEKVEIEFQTDVTNSEFIEEIVPFLLARDIAYNAYQNWVEINGEESILPILSYSPNQLFWIQSSSIYCHQKLPNNFILSFVKYQTLLSARHSVSFAEDFSCPDNTPMNPTEKC